VPFRLILPVIAAKQGIHVTV